MMSKNILGLILVKFITFSLVLGHLELPIPNEGFDSALYEEVLDEELCEEQLDFIDSNTLLAAFFADAGFRIPKGIFEANNVDLGNYHQCLGLNQQLPTSELQGKYCMIQVPLNQAINFPINYGNSSFDPNLLSLDEMEKIWAKNDAIKTEMLGMSGIHRSISPESPFSNLVFRLAVCIPRSCTTKQALRVFDALGLQYTDEFCRLPNDKPWVPADTVAVVVFSIIGFLTILSTSYDVWQTVILKNDPKSVSALSTAFSVYTNGRRVMNFTSSDGNIECLDGIRALAMAWVVLGHTFSTETTWANPIEAGTWVTSWQSIWIVGAHVTVDTFFTLSGFLVVYTTTGKFTGKQLIKNVHLFWLNRLLRMFPLLATVALLEASFLMRFGDGPQWGIVADHAERCRTNWWSTLLYMQNYMNPIYTCIGQTWYLAIDVQLHILSPILLFWVLLGNRKIALTALFGGLLAILTASTTYNFINNFPTTISGPRARDYLVNYYVNTLTRASPFFVGMIFGYFVRTIKIRLQKWQVLCFWLVAFSVSTFIMYANYPTRQPTITQTEENLFNSFIRPAWALFIGSMIYMCVNGYGGPINWFLSLSVWKIHSRLSYGIYLFHSAMMFAINHRALTPIYFSISGMLFKFLSHYTLYFIVTFIAVVLIDAPCSTLFKLILGGGVKKPQKHEADIESSKKEALE
ncbi:unnamed protein product [Chrysodeixis includens]|uniref:Nose resistant-to-fluoxetine protein N-terminal domain-containing protein n=1 Tax=Chrysodeixis includens TaxID=689277 RepID=A0A9P0BQ94_CHRIL|nr:unnamed protein product [Chrysodeixis includens]